MAEEINMDEEFDVYTYEGRDVKVPKGSTDDLNDEQFDSLLDSLASRDVEGEHQLKVEESKKATDIMFPRTSKLIKETGMGDSFSNFMKNYPKGVMAMGGDLLSGVGRTVSAVGKELGSEMAGQETTVLEQMDYLNRGLNPVGEPRSGVSGFLDAVAVDPATPPSLALGGVGGKWALQGGKWVYRAAKGATVGAGEGAVSSAIHQAENVLEGKEISPKEIATEIGVSTIAPTVIGTPLKFANKALGSLAASLGNVSEETLRKWGTGFGKGAKELKKAHGTQKEIGDKLLNALENFDEFIPEKKIVDDALEKMPNVNLSSVIEALEQSKTANPIGISKKVNTQIDELINDIQQTKTTPIRTVTRSGKNIPQQTTPYPLGSSPTPASRVTPTTITTGGRKIKRKEVPASEFRKIRVQLDETLESAFAKDYLKGITKAVMKARNVMMGELKESAKKSGVTEYEGAMASWADKLQKRDALIEEIGKSSTTRGKRIETFMSTLYNKNKATRRKALDDLKDVFGEDFLKEAKLVQQADEIIDPNTGMARVLPNTPSKGPMALLPAGMAAGASHYFDSPKGFATALLMAAEASPMASSKVLTVADLAEWMGKQSKLPIRKQAHEMSKQEDK